MSKSHQLGGPFSVKWRWCYFLPALPLKVLTFWPRWLPPGIPVLSTALRTLLWILYDPGKNYVENIRENSNISKMSTPNCDQFMCMWSLLPKAPELVSSVHNMSDNYRRWARWPVYLQQVIDLLVNQVLTLYLQTFET